MIILLDENLKEGIYDISYSRDFTELMLMDSDTVYIGRVNPYNVGDRVMYTRSPYDHSFGELGTVVGVGDGTNLMVKFDESGLISLQAEDVMSVNEEALNIWARRFTK